MKACFVFTSVALLMPFLGHEVQTVFQSRDPSHHLTETSPLITKANTIKLYAEWRRFWNVSRPILLEKFVNLETEDLGDS